MSTLQVSNIIGPDGVTIGGVSLTGVATQAEAEAGADNSKLMTSLRVAQAIDAQAAIFDYQVFTASGTWNKPAGLSATATVFVEMWAGGGGGGRAGTAASNGSGGGGGGAYTSFLVLASELGSSESVEVGSGGLGRTGSVGAGGTGGASTFGGVSVFGGNGGSGSEASLPNTRGGDGGTPYFTRTTFTALTYEGIAATKGETSGGDIQAKVGTLGGGGGGASTILPSSSIYGGGGGAGSPTSAIGGTSVFGGNGGDGVLANILGLDGNIPAGGGGGAKNANGGNGGRGEVRITTRG